MPPTSPPSTSTNTYPAHLDPSELGTKEYWDAHYTEDLQLQDHDGSSSPPPLPSPSELTSWFDDVDAPARTLAFLTSSTFPLSPHYVNAATSPPVAASILDLGTGNGSALFQLRLSGNFTGPMLGIDYSPQSISLARTLAHRYASTNSKTPCGDIQFEVLDLTHSDPATQPWWPGGGFDLVLDKGTFDAISLSSETTTSPTGTRHRACELYPSKVLKMVKPGGFLLVTSCNWTEEEVVHWFTASEGTLESVESAGKLEIWGKVRYPKYKFGGQEGQGIASICFRRVS